MASKRQLMVNDWLKDPTTAWFFSQISRRFGAFNDAWRTANTLEDLYKLRGRAEVLDHIDAVVKDPDSYAS